MAMQLTAEQERRLVALAQGGGYASPGEALDDLLSSAEADSGGEAVDEEFERLLLKGLYSPVKSLEEFEASLDRRIARMPKGRTESQ